MSGRARAIVALVSALALAGGVAGCTASDSELEAQLEQVTAERDALPAQIDADAVRYDNTIAVHEEVRAILDDPEAYGTEDEVVAALAALATPEAEMYDDAYGDGVGMQQAWYQTLYSGAMDSRIELVHEWVARDGSQSGGLWLWYGTNLAGNEFQLVGVQIDDHDDDGLITHELVVYPYPDAYVIEALEGAGTTVIDFSGE
ncbi:hypothetical protein [Microbacterium thalassium]|uniref:Nuclear transport factor 2 family protein n=1 Tax=Microbacterium thalassium TaxID=362649 RepID=A0A7X0FRD6_9MICO|nr:hypothetical protein [Microbacterium thalassium]MBB6392303.1 hypothetical protein [Microbacterium thalassium]GLK23513.1 hypothetical protein GCM10017607_08310 [Microbacterium thalassium]